MMLHMQQMLAYMISIQWWSEPLTFLFLLLGLRLQVLMP
jgi:hypothetical protein